jgi:hypothetical protein
VLIEKLSNACRWFVASAGQPAKNEPKVNPKPTSVMEEDAVKFVEKLGGTVSREDQFIQKGGGR